MIYFIMYYQECQGKYVKQFEVHPNINSVQAKETFTRRMMFQLIVMCQNMKAVIIRLHLSLGKIMTEQYIKNKTEKAFSPIGCAMDD